MRILITGAGGQLGFDLVKVLAAKHKLFALTKTELDIRNLKKVMDTVDQIKPHVIIHAAAFTNVDHAETSMEEAFEINAVGTKNMALAANRMKAKLVYISTDYVFDGTKGTPYTEFDNPSPLSVYGNSKLQGEKFVEMFSDKFYILRTAWLFGKHGNNFVKRIISLAESQNSLAAVTDQIGSPTYSLDLAQFIRDLIQTESYGVYHTANKGYCSKYEFTKAILEAAGLTNVTLMTSSIQQFHLPAARPANSALDDLGIRLNRLPSFRDWNSALEEFVSKELKN